MSAIAALENDTTLPDLADPATFVPGVPHAAFDRIRAQPGLYWQPARFGTINGGFWVVTRHADILAIEKDTGLFSSNEGLNFPSSGKRENPDLLNHLMYMDPPDHSRVRRAAAKAFSPRVVANFDAWVREIVIEVLDECERHETFDFIDLVARLIPSRVIARIMGVPFDERSKIVNWADIFFLGATKENAGEERAKIYAEIHEYANELRERKLTQPADDMVSELADSERAGDISNREFLYFVHLLIVAGYETTHTLFGQSMRLIVESPDIRLATDDAVTSVGAGPVVDEFLRYVSPVMNMARTATRDVDMFGEHIREGDMMQMMFTAANRDPSVFATPHGFDPLRSNKALLSFGSGPHRCLGSSLARLEVMIFLEEMAQRGMKLKLAGEPKRGWSTWVNQLTVLPVAHI